MLSPWEWHIHVCNWSSLEGETLWRIPPTCQGPVETILQTSALIPEEHGLQTSLTSPVFIPRVTLSSALLVMIVPEFTGN